MYLQDNQQCNLDDENEEEEPIISIKHFRPKFMKQLNFQQNTPKWRERKKNQRRKISQIKQLLLENLHKQIINEVHLVESNKKSDLINKKQDVLNRSSDVTNKNSVSSNKNSVSSNKNSVTSNPKVDEQFISNGHKIKNKSKRRFLHGNTNIKYPNGIKFQGQYKNGIMKVGHFDFQNGYEYWGQLDGAKLMGKGTLKCPDGKKITTVWHQDQVLDKAEVEYPTGDIYYGKLKNFKKHGQGYLFFKNGNKYIGQFSEGKINGMGSYYVKQQLLGEGLWLDGQLMEQKAFNQTNSFTQDIEQFKSASMHQNQNKSNFKAMHQQKSSIVKKVFQSENSLQMTNTNICSLSRVLFNV